ncbi:hypothetical protein [Streptomyces sp. PA5.6]|uniref:hypothetical protein n=1 Tax=Streptomyces sp. PA5.6 TaxID=3035651 RepID=UPI003904B166
MDDDVSAVSAFEDLLTDYMDETAELCPAYGTGEWQECSCSWCTLVLKVEGYRDAVGDDAPWHRLLEQGVDGATFGPPGLKQISFWVKRQDGEPCAA